MITPMFDPRRVLLQFRVMTSVVTGGGRGIGLELVRQLSEGGGRVHAVVRDAARAEELAALAQQRPERVVVHEAQVTEDKDVEALVRALEGETIALVINNAGTMESDRTLSIPASELARAFEVNAIAPLRVTRALAPLLDPQGSKVVHVSTRMASLADLKTGGYYGYRMSKAALNMASRTLALDLADAGVISVVMHPGWVKTDMGGAGARLEIPDAVCTMLETIGKLDRASSGTFIDWRGRPIAW